MLKFAHVQISVIFTPHARFRELTRTVLRPITLDYPMDTNYKLKLAN